jgi:hypothetical protein
MLLVGSIPLALFLFGKNKIRLHLPIFLFVLNSLLFEILSNLFIFFFENNVIIFNTYDLFQLMILFAFFKKYYNTNYSILIFCLVFYLVIFLLTFNSKGTMEIAYSATSLIIVLLSILGLIFSLSNQISKDYRYINLVTFSLIFYNLSSLVLFIISNVIMSTDYNIWIIHNVIQMISFLIITYSIWKLPSKSDC